MRMLIPMIFTCFGVLIFLFIAVKLVKSLSKVNNNYGAGSHHDSDPKAHGPLMAEVDFLGRVRNNPTDSEAWAEWGLYLLSQAQDVCQDEKRRCSLIENGNGKLSTAYELNMRNHDIPHDWSIALLAAAAGCSPPARDTYIAKARVLAKKAFAQIDNSSIYYFYDWAEVLARVAPDLPDDTRRLLLDDAQETLESADKDAIDDTDYVTLWINVLRLLAELSPKAERISLLEKALRIYEELPEDLRKELPNGLHKHIVSERDSAHLLQEKPTQAANSSAGPQFRAAKPSQEPAKPSLSPAPISKDVPKVPPKESTLPVQTVEAPSAQENVRRVVGVLRSIAKEQEHNDVSGTAQSTDALENFAAHVPSSSSHVATPTAHTPAPYTPPNFTQRELPAYARPSAPPSHVDEQRQNQSTPSGYKPINYKKDS